MTIYTRVTADRASGNINERTQAIYDSNEPPNELRNHVDLRNLAFIHAALITTLIRRIAGSVVINDQHHGARSGTYGAHEFYTLPNPSYVPTCCQPQFNKLPSKVIITPA